MQILKNAAEITKGFWEESPTVVITFGAMIVTLILLVFFAIQRSNDYEGRCNALGGTQIITQSGTVCVSKKALIDVG